MAFVHFVIAGRNDNHGFVVDKANDVSSGKGTFRDKILAVMKWNVNIFAKVGLQHRFVFVEWGQYQGRDWLSPELASTVPTCHCVEVPQDIVNTKQNPPIVFQDSTAKNVGIARSGPSTTGPNELVIATNSDIFVPAACAIHLRDLAAANQVIYRASRWDWHFHSRDVFNTDFASDEEEFLKHIHWSNRLGGPGSWGNAAGDFTGASHDTWRGLQGYVESPNNATHLDSEFTDNAGRCGCSFHGCPEVWHRDHSDSSQHWATLPSLGGGVITGGRDTYNTPWGLTNFKDEPVAERVVRLVR